MISAPNDFGEPFTEEATQGANALSISVAPELIFLLAFVVVVGFLVLMAAWRMGLHAGVEELEKRKNRNARYIYEHIDYALEVALGAEGASRIERTKDLLVVIENRLGPVFAFHKQYSGPIGALKKALQEAEGKAPQPDGPKSVQKLQGTFDDLNYAAWKALNEFKAFWSQKEKVMGLLRAAQDELVQATTAPRSVRSPLWQQRPNKTLKGKSALKPVSQPTPETAEAPQPEPPQAPPPPPAPPPSNGGKKLPKHKRNMLA